MQTIARNTLMGGVAALLLMAGTAYGQTTTAPATGTQASPPPAALTLPPETTGELDEGVRSMRTAELEGMDVYSLEGEEIGEVEGLVRSDGQPRLVVSLGTGWFNWGGGDRVAIPLEHFQRGQDGLVVGLTDAQAAALEEYIGEIDQAEMTRYDTLGDVYTMPE